MLNVHFMTCQFVNTKLYRVSEKCHHALNISSWDSILSFIYSRLQATILIFPFTLPSNRVFSNPFVMSGPDIWEKPLELCYYFVYNQTCALLLIYFRLQTACHEVGPRSHWPNRVVWPRKHGYSRWILLLSCIQVNFMKHAKMRSCRQLIRWFLHTKITHQFHGLY